VFSFSAILIEMDLDHKTRKTILSRLKRDPVYHVREFQGVLTTEPYQEKIMRAVAEHERVVISACHDVGKTWTMSKVILWFTSTYEGAKVITTAPTFNQVKRLLWSEIRAGFQKSKYPLGGEMLTTEWKIADDWFAIGFTSKADGAVGASEGQGQASTFQGFHAKYILVVFDEATGISSSIWKQVEGLLTSGFVRFVAIGNPTTKACDFYKTFSSPAYHKIYLSCFDSPNFISNGLNNFKDLETEYIRLKEMNEEEQYRTLNSYKLVNQYLLTVKWVMQMCLKWGLDHPLVVSKCFGKFPEEDESTLISLGTVLDAQSRTYNVGENDRVSIGVDVARFGADKTVITLIQGKQVILRKTLVKRDTSEITGHLVRLINEVKSQDIHVVIDATGLGSGVVDSLKEKRAERLIPLNTEVRECHFGGAPGPKEDDKRKYLNLKSRIFILLSEDLKADLCLLDEDIYAEELPTIKYKFDSKGRWVIESKEDYRARTGRGSPDDADSLALANWGRYDGSGVGKFTESLIQGNISTIVNYSGGNNLW
jgi:phage terminase large subunit